MVASLIGIDFGTAVTRAVRWSAVDDWPQGVVTVPSLAVALPDGLRVGRDAQSLVTDHPDAAICGVKRLLEKTPDDEQAQAVAARAGASLYAAGARLHVRTGAETAMPIDGAVAALLHQAASLASPASDGGRRYAVVTTPEWYGSMEQGGLRAAAERAGIGVVRLIGEGAALALWMARSDDSDRTLAIVNAGAGGVSVTIATIDPQGVYIAATADDARRGGDDVTAALVDGIMAELPPPRPGTWELVRQAVETLRPQLISQESAEQTIRLPGVSAAEVTLSLDRTDLVPALNSLGEALDEACELALDEAELEADEIDAVIATGGMSAFPQVLARLSEAFDQAAEHDATLDHQVVLGAAYEAAVVTQQTPGPLVLDGQSTGTLSITALT